MGCLHQDSKSTRRKEKEGLSDEGKTVLPWGRVGSCWPASISQDFFCKIGQLGIKIVVKIRYFSRSR
jgi:hypothetical protein